MKKILLFLTILALPLVSCKKYLEVEPTNTLTLTTYNDVKALMGSYIRSFTTTTNALKDVSVPYRSSTLGNNNHLFFALYADELNTDYFLNHFYAENYNVFYKECLNWKNMTYPGTLWSEYFNAIGFLNTVVDGLADAKDGTPAEKEIVRGEAKVLRAWYLFKVLQYFSPYDRDDLGIPFNFDSKRVGDYDRSRQTQTKVYNTIISELEEVIGYETLPKESYNIWYDKKIAHAILAQVYLFKGGSGAGIKSDYENAITHAKAAMEGRTIMALGEYEPFVTLPYNTFGFVKNTPQALVLSATNNSDGMYAYMNVNSSPQFVREEVYNLYKDTDVRKGKFFKPAKNSMRNDAMDPAVNKYQNVTLTSAGAIGGGSTRIFIFNFFAISDLHLIVAESYARLNDQPNAKLWLESFQKERYTGYTSFTGNDVLAEILLERRREFFLESDYRWCDLIRQNEEWTRKSDGTDATVPTNTIKKGDYRYCMPIPSQEMSYNKIEQNPGWGM